MIRPNKLRKLLDEGKPTLCFRVTSLWPDLIEFIGMLGIYDYVEFSAEYAPFNLQDMDNFCRAAELHGLGTMIKLDQDPRIFLGQRSIGSGFESILFADCRTKEEVEQCVCICRADTPADGGLYGAAVRRFAYGSSSNREEFKQALRDIVVAIMVEKKALVDDLENVLSVPGIGMVQWGGSDYSMTSGLERGGPAHQKVQRYVIETCLKKGVPPRVELASLEGIEPYLEMGVRHFSLGGDLTILRDFWAENGARLRDILSTG